MPASGRPQSLDQGKRQSTGSIYYDEGGNDGNVAYSEAQQPQSVLTGEESKNTDGRGATTGTNVCR